MDNSIFALHRYPYTDYHQPIYDITTCCVPAPHHHHHPCPPPPCPPPCPPCPPPVFTCPIGVEDEIANLKLQDIALDEKINNTIKTQRAHGYPKNDNGELDRWHITTPEQFSQWVELMNNGYLDNRCYLEAPGDYWIPYSVVQNVCLHITSKCSGCTLWIGDATINDVAFYNTHCNWAGADETSRLSVRIGEKSVNEQTGKLEYHEKNAKLYFEGGDCSTFNKVDFFCTVGFWGTYGRMLQCGFMKPSEDRMNPTDPSATPHGNRLVFSIGGNISFQKCRWLLSKYTIGFEGEQSQMEMYGAQEWNYTGDAQGSSSEDLAILLLYRCDARIFSALEMIQSKIWRGINALDSVIFINQSRFTKWNSCKNSCLFDECHIQEPNS